MCIMNITNPNWFNSIHEHTSDPTNKTGSHSNGQNSRKTSEPAPSRAILLLVSAYAHHVRDGLYVLHDLIKTKKENIHSSCNPFLSHCSAVGSAVSFPHRQTTACAGRNLIIACLMFDLLLKTRSRTPAHTCAYQIDVCEPGEITICTPRAGMRLTSFVTYSITDMLCWKYIAKCTQQKIVNISMFNVRKNVWKRYVIIRDRKTNNFIMWK